MLHKNSILGDRHPIHDWLVADNAAKTALTLTSADVGKVAYQIDTATFYILRDDSPATWVAIGDASAQQAAWEAYADSAEAAANGYADGIVAALSSIYQPLDTQLTSLAALDYTSNALKTIRVNAGETGFELATPSGGGGGREVLTAARTYYVRTDGSDSNTGLVDSAGGAFLTIQKAVDIIAETLDLASYQVTIQVRDGTYTGVVSLKNYVGLLVPIIQGNSGTPANVLINTTGTAISNSTGRTWKIQDLKLQSTTIGLYASDNSTIQFTNIIFGVCTTAHLYADRAGILLAVGNYAISGSATYHAISLYTGVIVVFNRTITFLASITVTYFVYAIRFSLLNYEVSTFTLGAYSVTGTRYRAEANSVLYTGGGDASFFPGSIAGSTATGGQYV